MGVEDNPLYFGATTLPIIRKTKNFPYQKRIDALKASSCNQEKILHILNTKKSLCNSKSLSNNVSKDNEKRYSCKSCSYSTAKKGMFNLHQFTVHGDKTTDPKHLLVNSGKLFPLLRDSKERYKNKRTDQHGCDLKSVMNGDAMECNISDDTNNITSFMERHIPAKTSIDSDQFHEMNIRSTKLIKNIPKQKLKASYFQDNPTVPHLENNFPPYFDNQRVDFFPNRFANLPNICHPSFWRVIHPARQQEKLPNYICELCSFKSDLWKFREDQNDNDRSSCRHYPRINSNPYFNKKFEQFRQHLLPSSTPLPNHVFHKRSNYSDFSSLTSHICSICGKSSSNMDDVIIPNISSSSFDDIELTEKPLNSLNNHVVHDNIEDRHDKFTQIKDEMSVGLELFIRKMDEDIKEFAYKYPEKMEKYIANGYNDYSNAKGFMDTVVQIRSGRKVPYQDRINALNLSNLASEIAKQRQVQNKQWPDSNSTFHSQISPASSPATNVVECIDELIRRNYNAIR